MLAVLEVSDIRMAFNRSGHILCSLTNKHTTHFLPFSLIIQKNVHHRCSSIDIFLHIRNLNSTEK